MRPEGNPLDLNNLPEDNYTRDGKQPSEDSSSSAGAGIYRKKKNGAKDEAGKVYECRFCSLKFCKSQALGGHMNRHRQERETETLNKARQLVFTNDLAPGHLGYVSGGQPIPLGSGYNQGANNMGDPPLPFRSIYSTRLFPSSSPHIPAPPPSQPQAPPYIYTSPQRQLSFSNSQYHPPPPLPPVTDYFVGHVLPTEGNYTCIGAPVGPGFVNGSSGGGRDVTEGEGVKWGRGR